MQEKVIEFNKNIIEVLTFYHFCELPNAWSLRKAIFDFCQANNIKGTILLGLEGINATISSSSQAINQFKIFMNTQNSNFKDIHYKSSYCDKYPFQRLKVKVKPEIVTFGLGEINVNEHKGDYIEPEDWDNFISQNDVVNIDTRNIYEIEIGTFKGSVNPNTEHFRDFPEWAKENLKNKKQKIAMYCTGGVRCEKSTTYLKEQGYENVYHLKGGIINYLDKTHNKNKIWNGHCFVFDDRVSLDDNLQPHAIQCKKCNRDLLTEEIKYGWHASGQICEDCRK